MTFDDFYKKEYDVKNYNCYHFLFDYWDWLGSTISEYIDFSKIDINDPGVSFKTVWHKNFKKVKQPKETGVYLIVCRMRKSDYFHVCTYHNGIVIDFDDPCLRCVERSVIEDENSEVRYYEYTGNFK